MKSIITLALLGLSINCIAQQTIQPKDTLSIKPRFKEPATYNNAIRKPAYLGKLNKDTSGFAKWPLYLVKLDGSPAKYYHAMPQLGLIDQKNIKSMEILKGDEAKKQFPENANNGVVIITLTKETQLFQITQLFSKYNIKKKYQTLPIYLDSNLIRRSPDMVFLADKIKTIAVYKEKGTDIKYISILTTDNGLRNIRGLQAPDNEIHIRGTAPTGE